MCVYDCEKLAKNKLLQTVSQYITGSATDELTLEDNKLFSFLKILFATSSIERCVCYQHVH